MFALTADHIAVRDMARAFADERIAPNALAWDEAKHFPVDVLREAAALGMAAIYVARGARRLGHDAARRGADLRGAGDRLSRASPAYLSIHNMVAWMIDRFGSAELAGALSAEARHDGACCRAIA